MVKGLKIMPSFVCISGALEQQHNSIYFHGRVVKGRSDSVVIRHSFAPVVAQTTDTDTIVLFGAATTTPEGSSLFVRVSIKAQPGTTGLLPNKAINLGVRDPTPRRQQLKETLVTEALEAQVGNAVQVVYWWDLQCHPYRDLQCQPRKQSEKGDIKILPHPALWHPDSRLWQRS
jgi:hypothetical protein